MHLIVLNKSMSLHPHCYLPSPGHHHLSPGILQYFLVMNLLILILYHRVCFLKSRSNDFSLAACCLLKNIYWLLIGSWIKCITPFSMDCKVLFFFVQYMVAAQSPLFPLFFPLDSPVSPAHLLPLVCSICQQYLFLWSLYLAKFSSFLKL